MLPPFMTPSTIHRAVLLLHEPASIVDDLDELDEEDEVANTDLRSGYRTLVIGIRRA